MFDHYLESSQDVSNKWSNVRFGEEIGIIEIEICTLSGALHKHLRSSKGYCLPQLNGQELNIPRNYVDVYTCTH